MLKLVNAVPKDAEVLAKISKRAFDSDVNCGGSEPGGPPGYDVAEWQVEMMHHPKASYYKILLDDKIIGGSVVFEMDKKDEYFLGRIFIDTDYHGQGLGGKAMEMLEGLFLNAKRWLLDTPAWNDRTRHFYLKVGYTLIKEEEFLLFEKITNV